MARKPDMREHEIHSITSYTGLAEEVRSFVQGEYNFLTIIGNAGIAKTVTLTQAMTKEFGAREENGWCYIKGIVSPRRLFQKIGDFKDRPMVFDDSNTLLRDKDCGDIMLGLCDTTTPKYVSYEKMMKTPKPKMGEDDDGDIEDAADEAVAEEKQRIVTNSPVCIVTNSLGSLPPAIKEAVLDRSQIIYFAPSKDEIHANVGTWFFDPKKNHLLLPNKREMGKKITTKHKIDIAKEIYDFVGEHLWMVSRLSMRMYDKSLERASRDWKSWLLGIWNSDPKMKLFVSIEEDKSLKTVEDKANKYVAELVRLGYSKSANGGCRANYFNQKNRFTAWKRGLIQPKDIIDEKQFLATDEQFGLQDDEINSILAAAGEVIETGKNVPKKNKAKAKATTGLREMPKHNKKK